MAKFNSFEEIKAWQKAYEVTLAVYRATADGGFSKDYGLKDQIRRASVSIMANIAEGHGRRSNSEFANFPNMREALRLRFSLTSTSRWVLGILKKMTSTVSIQTLMKFRG